MARTRWKEGTDKMKNVRGSNPRFLRTRLAVMAAILTVGVAGLASTTCHKPLAKPQALHGAAVGLIMKHDGASGRTRITAAQGEGLTMASGAITDASVMWGSFATPRTCGEPARRSSVPPVPGAAE